MKNIALLEDHLLVREGLERLITLKDDYVVIGSFDNAEALLASTHLSSIDLLITDIQLGDMDGLSLAETLKHTHPAIKFIVLSMYESALYVSRAQSIGIEGYVSKREASVNLLEAADAVLQGETCYESVLSAQCADEQTHLQVYLQLTDREKQIFILLAQGHKIKQISAALEIAVKTVHAHKQNIFQKMKLHSDFETTRIGLKLGLIDLIDL
jgi:DNA-binding NarL/FixJ family response regulator